MSTYTRYYNIPDEEVDERLELCNRMKVATTSIHKLMRSSQSPYYLEIYETGVFTLDGLRVWVHTLEGTVEKLVYGVV